jgi:hypothetical protein
MTAPGSSSMTLRETETHGADNDRLESSSMEVVDDDDDDDDDDKLRGNVYVFNTVA